MKIKVRAIENPDNLQMKEIITSSLAKLDILGEGCTSEDKELHDLSSSFSGDDKKYCVVVDEETNEVLGGGGFARLKGTNVNEGVCEFQKFYFTEKIQGKGLGKKLLSCLVDRARNAGYRVAYLETHHKMEKAIKLYEKHGFKYLEKPMGNTGHHQRSFCMCKCL